MNTKTKLSLFALGLIVVGVATQLPGSPLRVAPAQNFVVEVSDGFRNQVKAWNTSVVWSPDGQVAAGQRMVMHVDRPDGSQVWFEQLTDADGHIRGQIYGSVVSQLGTYTMTAQVAGGGQSAQDTFQISDPVDPAANTTYTGNNTFTGSNTFTQPIQATGGVDTNGATVVTDGGNVNTVGGNVNTAGGNINTANGNITAGTGTVTAASFTGNGSGLTSLNASSLSSGTVADARLSGNVALLDRNGQTFTGNQQLFKNTVDSATAFRIQDAAGAGVLTVDTATAKVVVTNIEGNGSGLTSLNGSNISSGTVADARLSGNVTMQGNTFNGASQLVQLNGSTQLPAVSGALLTTLNATNLSSGTVDNARLNSSVTLLGQTIQNAEVDDDLTISSAGSVDWTALNNYPAACAANQAITALGDTVTCSAVITAEADTLDSVYERGNVLGTSDARDIIFTLADTTTDSNAIINIATGSTSAFKVQSNGADVASIGSAGQLALPTQGPTGGILLGGDTNLYHSGADQLKTDDQLVASKGFIVDDSNPLQTVLLSYGGGAGRQFIWNKLQAADTQYAFRSFGDGKMEWGPGGSTAPDTNLYRSAVDTLKTDSDLHTTALISTGVVVGRTDAGESFRAGQAGQLWDTGIANTINIRGTADQSKGGLTFGFADDTNLFRAGASLLKTDDTFQSAENINASTESIGSTASGTAANFAFPVPYQEAWEASLWLARAGDSANMHFWRCTIVNYYYSPAGSTVICSDLGGAGASNPTLTAYTTANDTVNSSSTANLRITVTTGDATNWIATVKWRKLY